MRFLFLLSFCAVTFSATAQDQGLRDLDRTLTSYYENVGPLKVHLTLNQPSYVAGDTIFFRAVTVEAGDQKRIEKNTILHVMLMNGEGNAVTNQKVRLAEGAASNQVIIPTTLAPGLYVLVAYHDWMKNSAPEFFFQHMVLIHGPQQFVRSQANELEFFPEGGHLIAGVENRVVVKGGYNSIINVANASGQAVASLSTDENGFGSFMLTPAAGSSYSATSQNKSFPLPQAETSGVALQVKQRIDAGTIEVSASTSQEALQRVRVTLDAKGSVYYNTLLKMEQGKLTVSIPTNELSQGVARVSVFGEKGNVLAERLVFVAIPPSITGNITLDGNRFATRQKVTAKMKLTASEDLTGALLAASVFNKSIYSEPLRSTADANFGLYTNVQGSLTNASLGYATDKPEWRNAVDMLLISNKQNRAPWSDVLAKNEPAQRLTNIRFSGQIVNEQTGAVMTDTTFVTLFLQKNAVTYQTFTSRGKFDLPLYIDFFGQDEVYYKIERRGKPVPDARIEIVEEPSLAIDWPVVKESPTADPVFVNARQQRLITNAFGYNRQAQNYKNVTSANAQIEEEIFGADVEIDLEKFLVFPTMEETIREIIPMVQHRKTKNVSTIRVYFSDVNRQALVSPIFVIDGVMTDDTEYFMRLKPTEVSKIKIVNTREKLKTFGAIGRGGVIMVETKLTDNFSKVPRSKNSFVVHGLSEPVKAKAFDGAAHKDKVPDLRAALYWNPEIAVDENGEATFSFYTSDVTGDYTIVLDGIAPSGQPVHVESAFTVEFKTAPN